MPANRNPIKSAAPDANKPNQAGNERNFEPLLDAEEAHGYSECILGLFEQKRASEQFLEFRSENDGAFVRPRWMVGWQISPAEYQKRCRRKRHTRSILAVSADTV